eukprot:Sdes_comp16113_c0_seq1m5342
MDKFSWIESTKKSVSGFFDETHHYETLTTCLYLYNIFGLCAFLILCSGVTAPYGRYSKGGVWGFLINSKLAWFLQESPAFFVPVFCILTRGFPSTPSVMLCILLYMFHYFYRAFVYPFRIRGGKPTPILIVLSAFIFCFFNGYIQMESLLLYHHHQQQHFLHPRFLLGVFCFFLG